MVPIILRTNDDKLVADHLMVPPFVDHLFPEVVIWGSRTFKFAYKHDGKYIFREVFCYVIVEPDRDLNIPKGT